MRRPHQLGGAEREGLLRGAHRRRLGRRAGRLLKFYEDPEKHPLTTPTGKLEFDATGLAEHFPDDLERPPVPKWIAEGISHEETIGTERAKKYPLLVMRNHPRWSVHSQHDDITWLREIETCKVTGPDGYQYQPVWLQPGRRREARHQARRRRLDLSTSAARCSAGAYVTERIMPGVVYIDHGAKYDPIVPGEIDRGGAINTIVPRNTTSKNAVGHAVSGFLVEVEKTDMEELKRKYPEAFEKPFHPVCRPGLRGMSSTGGAVMGKVLVIDYDDLQRLLQLPGRLQGRARGQRLVAHRQAAARHRPVLEQGRRS